MPLDDIAADLLRRTRRLRFAPPVAQVYHPLEYASAPHAKYVDRYGQGRREVLLVGMNPGPWGMAQTGIPFGEVGMARDWLDVAAPVERPRHQHPKRPVQGFDSTRSEISGARLWGWARETFRTPERFFERFYVTNYCPLCLMEASGKNRTPDKLPVRERERLFAACDVALKATVDHFQPSFAIGIGAFAEARLRAVLNDADFKIGRILHPSPASPIANRGWAAQATRQLAELGIEVP